MKKIIIVVEGSTEEKFVRQVIQPHFLPKVYVDAQKWITNRKLGSSGGGESYDLIENHVSRLISRYKSDKDVFISTMIDFYEFPQQGNTVYTEEVKKINGGINKVLMLEKKMEDRFNHKNFIPYVQLYEYETLLLVEPNELRVFYTDKHKEINLLKGEIAGKAPEEINDTPEGAPSKRITKYLPFYKNQKTTAGVITAGSIGLPKLRANCPHFNNWLTLLEGL